MTIEGLIACEGNRVVLDLTEVTLVEREAVRCLAVCEGQGVEFLNCPAFLQEWVASEKLCLGDEQSSH